MLIGSTYAWFTDTATTAVNTIQAGTLDVALQMSTDGGTTWEDAEGKTLNFMTVDNSENILWEPGCTYKLPLLRVVNKGNLALKYRVMITGIKGSAKLNEVIEWTISDADLKAEHHLAAKAASDAITITGHMKDDAGNEYQGLSIDGISITVYATQDTVEKDSNGSDYDKNAEYNPAIIEDSEAAESELSKNEENIYVALAGDITFDVKPYDQKPMGGDKTKQIVIDGKGYKLTFNNTNSDWNNVTWGNAKLVIKNAVIDNSGYNADGGPWNSHDISFKGNVEFENVVFTNAVALEGTANLKNVTISDKNATGDTYMLWIRAGSDVTLENVTIDGKSAVGNKNRAIAIKDEYVTNPAETTLTINGATITSDKYAAVYVTSASATTVNLNGVIDATGTADNSKVVQNGGATGTIKVNDNSTKVVKVATQEELTNAISSATLGKNSVTRIDLPASTSVTFESGVTAVPQEEVKNIVITGDKTTKIKFQNTKPGSEGALSYQDRANLTFEGITIDAGEIKGICARGGIVTFIDCTFESELKQTIANKFVFSGCTFNQPVSQVGYGCKEVVFDNCKFNTDGYGIKIYSEGSTPVNLTVKNCAFKNTSDVAKSAIFLDHIVDGITYNITVDSCTFDGFTAEPTPNYNKWATRVIVADSFVKTTDGQYIFSYQTGEEGGNYHKILTAEQLVVTVK
ncbi:MAG TPA: hypothetical protein DDW30_01215 [Clostridiales bacterium]|nr:hypothetical protein [Clostridiales bacterium]